MSELDNVMQWRGQPGHYEVWYLTFNHRAEGAGFWIRYTLEAPTDARKEPYCQLWFALFDARDWARSFGIHETFPRSALVHRESPFEISIGPSRLHHGAANGKITGGGH